MLNILGLMLDLALYFLVHIFYVWLIPDVRISQEKIRWFPSVLMFTIAFIYILPLLLLYTGGDSLGQKGSQSNCC